MTASRRSLQDGTCRQVRSTLAALSILALAAACGEPEPAAPPETYTGRGIVRQLDGAERELFIHHEAIPQFKDIDGEVVGMEAMAMTFHVAEPVTLEGFAPGDRIEFDFEVRWDDGPPLTVIRLAQLPPDARLAFEEPPVEEMPAEPEAPAGGAEGGA